MWVTFGHLRLSGHIMPDHAGDRGAVFLALAPHDHLAYQADPDDVSGLSDLIGVLWLMIGEELLAAPDGGSARELPSASRLRSVIGVSANGQPRRHGEH